MRLIILGMMIGVLAAGPANAQGIATWVGERLGVGDVGRRLDEANRQVKEAVPIYGQADEQATRAARGIVQPIAVEATAPILKNLILYSRNDALSAGTMPLPPAIFWEFQGFYSPAVLSARWRVGQGNELSLQANSFRFGDRSAIALDTVLVFRSASDTYSLWLWAHELAHIEQYRAWGIDDFAKRYIRDEAGVEAAANQRADEFLRWRAFRRGPLTSVSLPPPQSIQLGGLCRTAVAICPMGGRLYPVGGMCSCPTPYGNAFGYISP